MKKRRSPKSQLALARAFERSELNSREFSQKVGVHPSTLQRWCQRLRKGTEPRALVNEFTDVEVIETSAVSRQPSVEMALPFGVTLRFFGVQ